MTRGVWEWLLLFPFHPITVESFPFPVSRIPHSNSHFIPIFLFPFQFLLSAITTFKILESREMCIQCNAFKTKINKSAIYTRSIVNQISMGMGIPIPLHISSDDQRYKTINSVIKMRTNLMCCRTWSASERCCCCCWLMSRIPEWPADRRFTSGCWCPPYVQHTQLYFTKYCMAAHKW